jgi:two-component system chemotaxis response regulator CheB
VTVSWRWSGDPKENGHRPAADALFRTASSAYGSRVVGVVLSGYQDCGTAGMMSIKACGGISVVQDPDTALVPEMPKSVIARVPVDHVELVCPICQGVLTEAQPGVFQHFRCHVGHAFSLDSLIREQSEEMERALWAAVRSLEEGAALSRRLGVARAEPRHAQPAPREGADPGSAGRAHPADPPARRHVVEERRHGGQCIGSERSGDA